MGGASGAAIGAGSGLLGGTLIGSGTARGSGSMEQQRYDIGYTQCMYAKGHRVPVSGQIMDNGMNRGYGGYDFQSQPPSSGSMPPPSGSSTATAARQPAATAPSVRLQDAWEPREEQGNIGLNTGFSAQTAKTGFDIQQYWVVFAPVPESHRARAMTVLALFALPTSSRGWCANRRCAALDPEERGL